MALRLIYAGTAGEERYFDCKGIFGVGTDTGRRERRLNIGGNRRCGNNPSVTASPCQLPLHKGAFAFFRLRSSFLPRFRVG